MSENHSRRSVPHRYRRPSSVVRGPASHSSWIPFPILVLYCVPRHFSHSFRDSVDT
jgi:hypothetical protein